MDTRKTLVVINGVTGAIGTACLAKFSREEGVAIIGLSRKALPFATFARGGVLPDRHLVCSIGETDPANCAAFAEAIASDAYERVVYVHAVGLYPFELNGQGKIEVAHDRDGDGIDDRVMDLSHHAFFAMAEALAAKVRSATAFVFGGVADRYRPSVHQSWWKVMEKTRERMEATHRPELSFGILNISSVMCPHELITRPFVFIDTDADARYWLLPEEVATEIVRLSRLERKGVLTADLFHPAPYCTANYFLDEPFTHRKRAELGLAGYG